MEILSFISAIFRPAVDLIDALHTSDEEKGNIRNQLAAIQAGVQDKIIALETKRIEYEKQLVDARSDVVKAEIQGRSWLQRNWRPILMMVVIIIIANNYIIFPYVGIWTDKVRMLELPGALFALLTAGVGGYIVGRSGEKIAAAFKRLPGDPVAKK